MEVVKMFETWEEAAKYCEETFGVYVDWEERFFHCPECGEPILEEDWEDYSWGMCPICGNFLGRC
jgi:predicted RNA-binding Zn-ribbon protein involved in translation (DUF1610 family)